MGAAFVSFAGRRPLLEAKDGACNAPVAAARHPPSRFLQVQTWVFREASPDQGYLYRFADSLLDFHYLSNGTSQSR